MAVAPFSTRRRAAAAPPSTLNKPSTIHCSASVGAKSRSLPSAATKPSACGPQARSGAGRRPARSCCDRAGRGATRRGASPRGRRSTGTGRPGRREAVDEDDRHPALDQRAVTLVVGLGVGVPARHEDDPGDAVVEQGLDVLVLGDAAGRLGAEHGREPPAGQHVLDDLRERRKDRVLQLGHDQPDQAGTAATQLARALVAEDVERGEDRLPGPVADARLVVEDPADGRLADASLRGDLGQGCHGRS